MSLTEDQTAMKSLTLNLGQILKKFAKSPDFKATMDEIFGANLKIDSLQQQWLKKTLNWPTIEIVSSVVINDALGAVVQVLALT